MNKWARWVPPFALLREFLIVIGLKGVGALPEIKGSLGGQAFSGSGSAAVCRRSGRGKDQVLRDRDGHLRVVQIEG